MSNKSLFYAQYDKEDLLETPDFLKPSGSARRKAQKTDDLLRSDTIGPFSFAAGGTSDLASEKTPPRSTPSTSPPAASSAVPSSPPVLAAGSQKLFPIFKRKPPPTSPRSRSEPLRQITDNNATQPRKPPKLRQLTIDLGGPLTRRCELCGMEYTPSDPEDTALHKKFHAQNVGGVVLKKPVVDSTLAENAVWRGDDAAIVEIEALDTLSKRKAAEKVLQVVEKALGALAISSAQLWNQEGDRRKLSELGSGRYKAYLYMRGTECIGLCLAQRLSSAYPVLDDEETRVDQRKGGSSRNDYVLLSSSISTSKQPQKAVLGISRIWVSSSARRKGVAVTLLETARKNFLFGVEIPKAQVAFSQPTESGGMLARKWFGMESGWLVYAE